MHLRFEFLLLVWDVKTVAAAVSHFLQNAVAILYGKGMEFKFDGGNTATFWSAATCRRTPNRARMFARSPVKTITNTIR